MQTFYAFAVFLAVVDYKQFQSFFSAKSVAYEEKKNTKKKGGEKNWWWGASLPELPVARWQQFLSFFFSLFYFVLLFFFFLTRAADYAEKEGLLVMYRSRDFFGLVTQLTLCAGGGGGMMKPRIDLRMSKTIDMCGTWLLH